MLEVGNATHRELSDLTSQLAQDEVSLIDAENDLTISYVNLMQLVELDIDREKAFDVTNFPVDSMVNAYTTDLPPASAIIKQALQIKPQIKGQASLLESYNYALKAAKADFYPNICFNGTYNNYYFHDADFSWQTQTRGNGYALFSILISIPIANRNQAKTNYRLAKLDIQKQTFALKNTEKDLYKEIQQMYYDT